jgi:hypothetical protein
LGLISSAEIDSRAQARDLAELELLKADDYTLYGFSLASIFAFSLRSLYVLLCGFYPLPSPSWHLTHPRAENSMPVNSPFLGKYLAFANCACFTRSSHKGKSPITANEEASF